MPVAIGEVTTEVAPPQSRGAESDSGGGEGSAESSEHDIERMVEAQAIRYERVRAY